MALAAVVSALPSSCSSAAGFRRAQLGHLASLCCLPRAATIILALVAGEHTTMLGCWSATAGSHRAAAAVTCLHHADLAARQLPRPALYGRPALQLLARAAARPTISRPLTIPNIWRGSSARHFFYGI